VENDRYFAMVNELDRDEDGNLIDDIHDERAWLKANPIAASYPEGLENLRAKFREALEKPDKMDDFLTKNMNVWINKREQAFIPTERWAACGTNVARNCWFGCIRRRGLVGDHGPVQCVNQHSAW